jgi:hypothetical protein
LSKALSNQVSNAFATMGEKLLIVEVLPSLKECASVAHLLQYICGERKCRLRKRDVRVGQGSG